MLIHIRIKEDKELNNKVYSIFSRFCCVHHIGAIMENPHYHIVGESIYCKKTVGDKMREYGYKLKYAYKECDEGMYNYICKDGHKLIRLRAISKEEYQEFVNNSIEHVKVLKEKTKKVTDKMSSWLKVLNSELGEDVYEDDVIDKILEVCERDNRLLPQKFLCQQLVRTICFFKSRGRNRIENHRTIAQWIKDGLYDHSKF